MFDGAPEQYTQGPRQENTTRRADERLYLLSIVWEGQNTIVQDFEEILARKFGALTKKTCMLGGGGQGPCLSPCLRHRVHQRKLQIKK